VINFGERSEEECRGRWPDLMAIVEAKVKPGRQSQGSIVNPNRWWMFARPASNLADASRGLERVLAIPRVCQYTSFTILQAEAVFSEQLIVFPLDNTEAAISALQSRPHEVWVRFFASTFGDGLRYTPSDCFETFPFPENWDDNPALEAAGKAYYEFRAALMVRNDEGLTKTYNRFHNPDERDSEILKLRELHAAMDRVVLDAYGWSDIKTNCEFLLDYEIEEEGWGDKKKPWRFRWPDEVRNEVLARLLELNAERAKEEARSGAVAAKKRGKKTGAKREFKTPDKEDLFS
jgi:hypothetical protein